MRRAPTVVSYTEVAYTSGSSPMVSASVAWKAGDRIVVMSASESANDVPQVPTATGLTFRQLQANSAASSCASILAVADAAADGSSAITTTTVGAGGLHRGVSIWVLRETEGIGSSVEQHTSSKQATLHVQRNKSMILWGVWDFGAAALVGESPTATNDRRQLRDTGHYSIYVEDGPAATKGPAGYGVTGSAGGGPWSILAVEVFGTGREGPARSRRLR